VARRPRKHVVVFLSDSDGVYCRSSSKPGTSGR